MHNDFKAISSMEEKISFHEFTLSLYNLTTVSHKWVPSPHYCNREVETVSPVLLKSQGIIFFFSKVIEKIIYQKYFGFQ